METAVTATVAIGRRYNNNKKTAKTYLFVGVKMFQRFLMLIKYLSK